MENYYDLWVYPANETAPEGDVYVTEYLDEDALYILEDGGKVLLSPKVNKSTLPNSITGTFTTAFWSSQFVSESQPGSMGLLMDPEHPVFDGFPTEYHSNYQWWAMAKLGRPMVLENLTQEDGTFQPVGNPSQTTGFVKGNNTITFDPVQTSQVRITMVHQEEWA